MGRPHRMALRTTAMGAVSATLVAGGVLGLAPAARAGAGGVRYVDIAGDGGTVLKANVVVPSGTDGSRRHPLIVLPTSWGFPQVEYLAQAQRLADSGYVVLGYNVRGFWQSGGEIDVAGPHDVADAAKVVDWALANTPSDPGHVGMAGVSYGAGISLLAAAHDPRVKAVASLSGWGDLIDSIYSGRTQHVQAAAVLDTVGMVAGRRSSESQEVFSAFYSSDLSKEQDIVAWGQKRSPATYLDQLNKNGTAIMMAGAWGDTIFPPNQSAAFYERLTGPKRLEFRPGDHATAELTGLFGLFGLFGLPNDVWSDTERWFDHYLKGEDNGIDREQPVRLKSRSTSGYEGYPDWKSVNATRNKIALAGSTTIHTNVDSGADGGIVFLSSILDQVAKLPRWPRSPCSPGAGPPCGSPASTPPPSRCAAPRGCTPPSPRPRRAAPSSPTSTTWGRSASADWSPTRRTPFTGTRRAGRSVSTWTCSPRPTTSRRGTGSPWWSTRSTRSTSSTTRPARG